MQIIVRDNNVEQALRALKKKLQREGVYREMKLRRHYEKPSESAPASVQPRSAAPASSSASAPSAKAPARPFEHQTSVSVAEAANRPDDAAGRSRCGSASSSSSPPASALRGSAPVRSGPTVTQSGLEFRTVKSGAGPTISRRTPP